MDGIRGSASSILDSAGLRLNDALGLAAQSESIA
jgi:hypothetical protein